MINKKSEIGQRTLLHLILNLVTPPVFLIFTDLASLRRALLRKSLISKICLGWDVKKGTGAIRWGVPNGTQLRCSYTRYTSRIIIMTNWKQGKCLPLFVFGRLFAELNRPPRASENQLRLELTENVPSRIDLPNNRTVPVSASFPFPNPGRPLWSKLISFVSFRIL